MPKIQWKRTLRTPGIFFLKNQPFLVLHHGDWSGYPRWREGAQRLWASLRWHRLSSVSHPPINLCSEKHWWRMPPPLPAVQLGQALPWGAVKEVLAFWRCIFVLRVHRKNYSYYWNYGLEGKARQWWVYLSPYTPGLWKPFEIRWDANLFSSLQGRYDTVHQFIHHVTSPLCADFSIFRRQPQDCVILRSCKLDCILIPCRLVKARAELHLPDERYVLGPIIWSRLSSPWTASLYSAGICCSICSTCGMRCNCNIAIWKSGVWKPANVFVFTWTPDAKKDGGNIQETSSPLQTGHHSDISGTPEGYRRFFKISIANKWFGGCAGLCRLYTQVDQRYHQRPLTKARDPPWGRHFVLQLSLTKMTPVSFLSCLFLLLRY